MSVTDKFQKKLACSLYALLRLRPNFLGAKDPEQLHQIFRSYPETKGYDDDKLVNRIRTAAGLKFTKYTKKVNDFVGSLKPKDQNRKIIIDIKNSHTFTIEYVSENWTRFDNDAVTGSTNIKYGKEPMLGTWE